MLTVPQAADRVRRSPDTIRRWIRARRLRARATGRRYMIDEADLLAVTEDHASVGLPAEWGAPNPANRGLDWARVIREAREERGTHLLEVLRTQR